MLPRPPKLLGAFDWFDPSLAELVASYSLDPAGRCTYSDWPGLKRARRRPPELVYGRALTMFDDLDVGAS